MKNDWFYGEMKEKKDGYTQMIYFMEKSCTQSWSISFLWEFFKWTGKSENFV